MSAPLQKDREERPARSLGIWALAWPAILSNLLHSIVGIVDMKIVGSLGASAVAAVTIGQRIFFVLQAILIAITAGTTALVARAWGAGDVEEAERVTRSSLWLCVGLGLVLTVPGIVFAEPLAGIFQLEAESVQLGAEYIRWLSVFNIAFAVNFVIGTALRAAGDTRTPLWIGAIVNVVNVFLAYGLVYGEFGMPALGVRGAALAGGLSFTFGGVVVVLLWLSGRLAIGYGPPRAFSRKRLRQLVHIGYPAALEQVVLQGGFIAFLWIVALYGTAPYAAYGIGVSLLSFSFVVGFGFSIAASTLVGQALGAESPEDATRSGWRAMSLSILTMLVFGTVIVLFAEPLAALMIDDPEVIRLTVAFIYVLGSVQVLMAIEFALGGALRGAGDTRFPLVTVLLGLLGVRCVLAGFFAWQGWSIEWVFGALIADYALKASLLIWRFRSGRWQNAL